jgi:hypothetical protein
VAKSTGLNPQAYYHPSCVYVFYGNHKFPFPSYKKCQTVFSYARKEISIVTQYIAGDHLHFEIASSAVGEESHIVLNADP